MEEIITKDGSITLRNEEYDETYHSFTGAYDETVKKFIIPCKIKELTKNKNIKILDIGFGLGYNSISAIDTIQEENENCEIEIMSLERDLKLDEIKKLETLYKHYDILKKLEFDPLTNSYLFEQKNIRLRILIGNGPDRIKKINDKFDAVFLDPFSPKKNPEMWTKEFFIDIKKLMKKSAILATYSCARVVRDNLRDAGFVIEDGPKVGRRGPSTIAKL
jgi:chorismate dehydratase